ncbi:hypothetical protein GCM10017655_07380 [Pseudomonas turukhanskensis]|uniref:Uncharacterized protein n=1 Tax=Pseudomonas turukhanskensis TaxID=1806536 RepID=A0A9W6K1B3_9PSED|nr:hypothetical protein GCM10017655_07380 [Pseudomonas turukhanskensis]
MALQPGPWSDDATREPEAQRRAQVGARFFGFFFMVRHSDDWKKKLARKARNKTPSTLGNKDLLKFQSKHQAPSLRAILCPTHRQQRDFGAGARQPVPNTPACPRLA